ncbi:c-type cytochrome [Frigidibacter sp. ROC022]|uniref:c-type cytochrome n=1 Tax=Frigidibacter sp. ROC022 TaxID=2971796 RepID=UPI00215AAE44|nr:c-type cytochrome [Frigidibacter sp. ROC022]MCR8726198.1 c-type cytochrome [Frigidibacter sp. ROC022]
MSKFLEASAVIALLAGPALAEPLGLGRPALPEEIAAWDHDVRPDGQGLPPGSGDVLTGEELFSDNCAACHGEFAEGVDNWPKLAGGFDTLDRKDPVKTVGSYWPYLSTVWDYVHHSMPFGNAQTLSNDETYAIVAYILYSNDLVDEDFTLSNENFLSVEMPNAAGFIEDDREAVELPLFSQPPCMENCKDSVEITAHASVLDVTPDDGTDDAAAVEPAPEDQAQAVEPPAPEPEPVALVEAPDPALVEKGAKVFKKCAACHKIGDGAKNGVGPALTGVFGRQAATADGFKKYSNPMKEAGEAGLVWDHDNLDAYLADPRAFLPKNRMAFAGLRKDADRAAVIAYLQSFSQ